MRQGASGREFLLKRDYVRIYRMTSRHWFLYAIRCADDTLYTGVTTDLARRVSEHNAGRGARYTAGRRPVELIGAWRFPDRGAAQRAEARFKRLPRRQKLALVAQELPFAGSAFYRDEQLDDELWGSIRFCPRCGGLLRGIKRPEDDRARQTCTVCGRIHYRNAKPCAGALVVRDGRLLLVKRRIEPYLGYWDIPGGFLEADELPQTGAVREVREETGLDVRLTELFDFYMGRYSYDESGDRCLNVYFLAEVVGGVERPSDDAADLAWFAPDELPERIAFEHARRVLSDWVRRTKEKQQ